jgi:hypothetical protein
MLIGAQVAFQGLGLSNAGAYRLTGCGTLLVTS